MVGVCNDMQLHCGSLIITSKVVLILHLAEIRCATQA